MIRKIHSILLQLYCRFEDDDVTALAAQMSYFLLLSIFPFLLFLLTLVSYTPIVHEDVLDEMLALLPESSSLIIRDIIQETMKSSNTTLLSVGMLTAVWTSTTGVMAVFRGINRAYDVPEDRPYWKIRLLSTCYMLLFIILALLTFLLLIFGDRIFGEMNKWLPFPTVVRNFWPVFRYVIPITMLLLGFTVLYKQAPNYPIRWLQATPGALVAVSCWIGLSFGFSYYVNKFGNFSRTYGSIGGVIALMIWLYLSSIVVIMGGEFNATLQFLQEGKKKSDCKQFGVPLFFRRKNDKQMR